MALHKVRTLKRPDEELEVDDAELTDLRFQGLLLESNATTDEGLLRAAERQAAKNKES